LKLVYKCLTLEPHSTMCVLIQSVSVLPCISTHSYMLIWVTAVLFTSLLHVNSKAWSLSVSLYIHQRISRLIHSIILGQDNMLVIIWYGLCRIFYISLC